MDVSFVQYSEVSLCLETNVQLTAVGSTLILLSNGFCVQIVT